MAHTDHDLRRAISDDPRAAFTDRRFPLGARIRALEWAEPAPEIYDALAKEAQDVTAGSEFHRGLAAGFERRAETLEATLRQLRLMLDASGIQTPDTATNEGSVHIFPPDEGESHGAETSCPCLPRQTSNMWTHNRLFSQ